MGLDLLHVRLSAQDERTPEFFTLKELEVFPGIVERHRHLITEVLDTKCIFTIYLFPDERDKQEYEKWPGKSESAAFLIGGIPDMEEDVFKIEKANHLNGIHKFIERIGKENEDGKSIIRIEYAPTYEHVPVIYWKEIGYQRKGMEPAFYEAFEDCKLYFKREDTLRASTYLSPVGSKYYTGTFKEQFIDNFIECESIFFASW
jgi:hypothetical protein